MTTEEFITYLYGQGVRLTLNNGRLFFTAPQGAATSALQAELSKRKTAVIDFLEKSAPAMQGKPLQPLPVAGRSGDTRPAFAQQRLWFLDRLEPGNAAYNLFAAIRITGQFDPGMLEQAINAVVSRHEILRTTFKAVDGIPVQVIAPHAKIDLPVISLETAAAGLEAVVQRLAEEDAVHPFDLARGPLLRCTVLKSGNAEHVLLINMHHIIADGWSIGVLVRELAALIRGYRDGVNVTLPGLKLQYADYCLWQRRWFESGELEKQQEYWLKQLEGVAGVLHLPADRERPDVQTYAGKTLEFELPGMLADKLRSLCSREGVTLFMLLLAAFQVLLHRYTGQEDIVIGTPIANRQREEFASMIGLFANTLVLRTRFAGDPQFRGLLRQVQETALGAYENQDMPFELLVDLLKLKRDMSRNPLFQVMFVFQNTPREPLEIPGLVFRRLDVERGVAQFDLRLDISEQAGAGINCRFEYNTALFGAATVKSWIEHFRNLLAGIVADPGQKVSAYCLLSAEERERILVGWNDTRAAYPAECCVHALFSRQAERTPQRTAVQFGNRQLTYAGLERESNRLAGYLAGLGVENAFVGICMERSPEMVTGLLGIMKAGAAYVPLDPGYPRERLSFMMADAGIAVLVTQQHLLPGIPEHAAKTICLDRAWEETGLESKALPGVSVTGASLVYVIYTSGSTGKPKGVQITHRSMVNFLAAMQRQPGFTETDRLLAVTTISFDIAGLEIMLPLVSGGCVVLADRETAADGNLLAGALEESRATVMQATPATWRMLLQAGWQGRKELKMLCGGEALSRELAGELVKLGKSLWNMYGPTETTVWSSVYEVKGGDAVPGIGKPIANTRMYILDRSLHPQPAGVAGELYIGGDGVSPGYLHRDALTAERFIENPFCPGAGSRMYRTGDLARFLPGGNIECLGRIDYQVKIRGFRIEPGEIESVLQGHPGIRAAVVAPWSDATGDKRLAAYLAAGAAPAPSAESLRAYLQSRLPGYMIPQYFVLLDALPLTPNGKVDRKALPAPDRAQPGRAGDFQAPRNPVEAVLAEIWCGLLRLERVSVFADFFTTGGHSLLILQVIARAGQRGIFLTPQQCIRYPTIAGLAAVAGSAGAAGSQGTVTGPIPVIPSALLRYVYSLPAPWWKYRYRIDIPRQLDAAVIKKAVKHLIAHHDGLRLRTVPDPGQVLGYSQYIASPDADDSFGYRELTQQAMDEQEAAIRLVVNEECAGLNIAAGPVIRFVYIDRCGAPSNCLLIIVHHIAADMISMDILRTDFLTACSQVMQGKPIQLPPKSSSLRAWAERMQEYALSAAGAEEFKYWTALPFPRVQRLPVDYPAGCITSAAGQQSALLVLTAGETGQLLRVCREAYNAQLTDILFTALVLVFRQWAGINTLWITAMENGRTRLWDDLDLARTTGDIASTYTVLLELEDQDNANALQRIKEQCRLIPYGGATAQWVYAYRGKLADSGLSLGYFRNIQFHYRGQFDDKEPGNPEQSTPLEIRVIPYTDTNDEINRQIPGWQFDIDCKIAEGKFSLNWNYYKEIYKPATVEFLVQEYLQTLRLFIKEGLNNPLQNEE